MTSVTTRRDPTVARDTETDTVERPRPRLPSGFVVHTLAVLAVGAELIGTIAALWGSEPERGRGTPVAPACCPVLSSTWATPDLARLVGAPHSHPGQQARTPSTLPLAD